MKKISKNIKKKHVLRTKTKNVAKRANNSSTVSNNNSISKKLDQILLLQKKLLKEENKIEQEEKVLEEEELSTKKEELKEERTLKKIANTITTKEQEEEEELKKLKQLEEQIKKEVGEHPLKKIGVKDVAKGFIGAFIGLAVHYTFIYGVEISEHIDTTRATFLYLLSFIVGILFIYATGFRKIKDPKILMFMPVRLFVLYIASIIMSIVVLFIFYPGFGHEFLESYKMVAGVLLAAVVGACTADLIGKE
ncbi:MAG: hypothetical protein ACP5NV_01805 [Candidatus Woesearchaeota archaeon]